MDILQLPTECIQHIINQLKIKKYNQYHLVNNWKPESHRDELNYNCIVSKPLKLPGFVRLDKKKYSKCDPIILARLCMVSKEFYKEFINDRYWKNIYLRDCSGHVSVEEKRDITKYPTSWYILYYREIVRKYYKKSFKSEYISYIKTQLNILIYNRNVVIDNYKIIQSELETIQKKLTKLKYMTQKGYIKYKRHDEWMCNIELAWDSNYQGQTEYKYKDYINKLDELSIYVDSVTYIV